MPVTSRVAMVSMIANSNGLKRKKFTLFFMATPSRYVPTLMPMPKNSDVASISLIAFSSSVCG